MKEHYSEQQEHWKEHFEGYDTFQEAYSKYCAMMSFHTSSLEEAERVLDSGAGTGNLTRRLLEAGHDVVAVDNNEHALNVLKDKCQNIETGTLVVEDIDISEELPFEDNSFDGVASSLVIPFVADYKSYLSEVSRVLREDGVLSLSIAIPKEGMVDTLMTELQQEAEEQGLLPDNQEAFERFWETSSKNEDTVIANGVPKDDLIKTLEELGFIDVEIPEEQPYDEYVIFMRASKA